MHLRALFMVLGAAVFGGSVVAFAPQVPILLDRPACVDTVMRAVSSSHPVGGTYNCFEKNFQARLDSQGIDSDQAFAAKVGQSGRYRLVGKTDDGGYAYEFDKAVFPHDGRATVRTALDVAWKRVSGGDIGGAWIPVQVTWNEVTGQNEGSVSVLVVLYADDQGKVWRIK